MVGRGLGRASLLAVILGFAAAPAVAQQAAFTAERLVRMESLGPVRLSANGRWAVVERRGRYDRAATYAYGPLTPALLSDLMLFDLDGRSPDRTIGVDDDAGYQAGPISPNGQRMVVYRLTAERRELGVLTLETGAMRWLGVTPELAVTGRTVAWRDNNTLLALITPDGALPLYYRLARQTQARVSQRWADALAGHTPTATYIPSGRRRDARVQGGAMTLVSIKAADGAIQPLASGAFFDLEIAPGGATVAVLGNGEDLQPRDARLTVGDPTRRRRLTLIDLRTGQVRDPLPDRDLLSHLLSWSENGRELLVFARRTGEGWRDGDVLRVPADGGVAKPIALGTARPAVLAYGGEKIPLARALWAGRRPAVLAETADGRRIWLYDGGGSAGPADNPFATPVWRDGALWSGPEATPLGSGNEVDGGSRGRANPSAAALGRAPTLRADGCILWTDPRREPLCPGDGDFRLVAAAGGRALTVGLDGRGVGHAFVLGAGVSRELAAVNTTFGAVAWGSVKPVAHADGRGGETTSWLLEPPGARPPSGWPLVALIYPGQAFGKTAPTMLRPGSDRTQLSPLVLAGSGYAVLAVSLPEAAAEGPAPDDLATRIGLAVDASLAQGGLDPDRVALMGHSFGGHGALVAATQTDRFRAVVASAGLADYGTAMRDTLHFSASPDDGVLINGRIGYFESGQGAVGALPWEDPRAYVQASPLYWADRIHSPLLLICGDLDPVANEAMFGALYRLDREAGLLTYWGEGHNLASPANIVDLHRRVIDWLGERLAPREAFAPAANP